MPFHLLTDTDKEAQIDFSKIIKHLSMQEKFFSRQGLRIYEFSIGTGWRMVLH